jgi:hypothetical protein
MYRGLSQCSISLDSSRGLDAFEADLEHPTRNVTRREVLVSVPLGSGESVADHVCDALAAMSQLYVSFVRGAASCTG